MTEQKLKALYLELCREEQKLINEMISGVILPDVDAPIQVRLDVLGQEIEKIKSNVDPSTIQKWLTELHP